MIDPKKRKRGQLMVVSAALGLLLTISLWCFKFSAAPQTLNITIWGVLALPMLLALPGFLSGKLYTYRWGSMLCLMYFTHGVMEAWAEPSFRVLGLAETVLSVQLFLGSIWFVQGEIGKRPKRQKSQ